MRTRALTDGALPFWFRAFVAGSLGSILAAFIVVRGSSPSQADAPREPWTETVEELADLPIPPLASGGEEPLVGSYRLNGMPVQYSTMFARDPLDDAIEQFREAYRRNGFKDRTTFTNGLPTVTALHPETKVLLSVRALPKQNGLWPLRLTQQNLDDIEPNFRAEIAGVPSFPGAGGGFLMEYTDGPEVRSLTFAAPASGQTIMDYYARHMQGMGWVMEQPPDAKLVPGVGLLFFRGFGRECTLTVIPETEGIGSLVFVTVASAPRSPASS